MNTTKWRISKACQECRAKKIKCNGETPCQNCSMRNLSCVYREKARNRTRKVKPRTAAYETIMSHDAMESTSLEPSDEGTVPPTPNADDAASVGPTGSAMDSERSLTHNSVAATHRASPSCFLQLYYGPSSNFALLNSIYHQIAGTCPNDPPSRSGIVEEVGPGLDLFSHRRLFFGDLADNQRPSSVPDDCSAMLIDPDTAHRLLERYLLTYWHGLPIMSKDHYRRRLSALYQPPGIFDYDAPETIIIQTCVFQLPIHSTFSIFSQVIRSLSQERVRRPPENAHSGSADSGAIERISIAINSMRILVTMKCDYIFLALRYRVCLSCKNSHEFEHMLFFRRLEVMQMKTVFSQSEDYFDLGVSRVCLLYPQPSCTRSLTVQRQHQKE
ncbi:hypothetical protein HZ326_30839, partial [Fusarium oxysporum f. sp. albedinis]